MSLTVIKGNMDTGVTMSTDDIDRMRSRKKKHTDDVGPHLEVTGATLRYCDRDGALQAH